MKRQFSGPFGKRIKRHLELQRSLGAVLKDHDRVLDDFDQYVAKHFRKTKTVSRPMVIGYLETTQGIKNPSRHAKLTILRVFCRFLFHLDPDSYIPSHGLLPPLRTDFRPHIYSLNEVRDLVHCARRMNPEDSLRPHTFATLIGLLWASGLRIGEALRLNLGDIDWETGVLHIEQTKFFKSRLVPLLPSAMDALRRYAQLRSQRGHSQDGSAPFFVNERSRRCTHSGIVGAFHVLTRGLGLKSLQGRDPRLHDFRHSLATHYLTRLYQQREDPSAGLPVLSTYLGHVNIGCTAVYLHPSLDVLQNAGSRFEQYAAQTRRDSR